MIVKVRYVEADLIVKPDLDQHEMGDRSRTPRLASLQKFHGLPPRTCFRCQRDTPKLDRAHVINHAWGGPSTVENMVPLCSKCHRAQPIFVPGEEFQAWAWFYADPYAYAASTLAGYLRTATTWRMRQANLYEMLEFEAEREWDRWMSCLDSGLHFNTWARDYFGWDDDDEAEEDPPHPLLRLTGSLQDKLKELKKRREWAGCPQLYTAEERDKRWAIIDKAIAEIEAALAAPLPVYTSRPPAALRMTP